MRATREIMAAFSRKNHNTKTMDAAGCPLSRPLSCSLDEQQHSYTASPQYGASNAPSATQSAIAGNAVAASRMVAEQQFVAY
jgi:hypothetical protein